MSEKLHFKVSAGLKNIIGKELINDKFIAIFELVKNSYDAGAKKVIISSKIFIQITQPFLLLMMEMVCQKKI